MYAFGYGYGYDKRRPDGGGIIPVPPISGTQEMLIVGHSLADNPLTQIMDQLAVIRNADDAAHMQNIVGAPLFFNYEHAAEANGNQFGRNGDTSGNGVVRLNNGGANTLILTEGGPFVEAFRAADTMLWVPIWMDAWVDSEYPTLRTLLYQIWPPIPDYATTPNWEAWRAGIVNTGEVYRYTAKRLQREGREILLIPVDAAFRELSLAVEAGTVPDLTDMLQIFDVDEIHINYLGFYFVAMCMYAAVYRETPVGLSHTVEAGFTGQIPGLTAALANRMQEIAWAVVQPYAFAGMVPRPDPTPEWSATPFVTDSWEEWPTLNTSKDFVIDVGAASSGRVLVFYLGNFDATVPATAVFNPDTDNIPCEVAISVATRAIFSVAIPDGLSGNQTLRVSADNFYTAGYAWTIVEGISPVAVRATDTQSISDVPHSFVIGSTSANVEDAVSWDIYLDETASEPVIGAFRFYIGYGESPALLPVVQFEGNFMNAIAAFPIT